MECCTNGTDFPSHFAFHWFVLRQIWSSLRLFASYRPAKLAIILAFAIVASSLQPRHDRHHPSSHHYWEGTYGEKPQKSAFTRFEGETARLYQVLEDQLKKQQQRGSSFIALDRPTIADFAFWSWTRIAGFGNIDLSPYPTVQKWNETLENDAKSQAAIKKLPLK